ncbi:carbohydrate porin [Vibrio vulnificus]
MKINQVLNPIMVAIIISMPTHASDLINGESRLTEEIQKIVDRVKEEERFRYSGYFRSGYATAVNGSPEDYFVSSVGRFGNENTGWFDLKLHYDVYRDGDRKVTSNVTLDGNVSSNYTSGWFTDPSADGSYLQFSDMYVAATGFIPALPGSTLWVGKHKLPNYEIQMFDFKHHRSSNAGAVALMDVAAGPGLLDISLAREDMKQSDGRSRLNTNLIDMRYKDIEIADDTRLSFLLKYQMPDITDAQKEEYGYKPKDAMTAGVVLRNDMSKGGFNELTLQMGTNSYASKMTAFTNADPDYRDLQGEETGETYRIVNQGESYFGADYIMAHSFVAGVARGIYENVGKNNYKNSDTDFLRAAVRPAYIWNQFNQTGVELGYFVQKSQAENEADYRKESGYKVTAYHALKVNTSMLRSRPEIRFYSTYMEATDNDITGYVFHDQGSDQLSFGVQAEVWW